jgi:hypothetical protein
MDRKEIVDYLAKKVFNGELTEDRYYYIILKNRQMYPASDYGKLVELYKISPEDAFVYFSIIHSDDESYERIAEYLFPLIDGASIYGIVKSYLSKLGFYDPDRYSVFPATGLKYYAVVVLFSDRLVIELTDIDTMATNTGLRKIVEDVLGKGILTQKEISSKQIDKISYELRTQELFAGHNRNEAYKIIYRYYMRHDTLLAKEVLAIANVYNRIFEPYRVVYDTRTRQQVLM